jgi:hypothetical protein
MTGDLGDSTRGVKNEMSNVQMWTRRHLPIAAGKKDFYLDRLYGAIIHEIGHAPPQANWFDFDHDELGLMQKGGSTVSSDTFTPKTIVRFRSTVKWAP